MRQIYGDLLAAFWLPALAGSVMAVGTWLVWFYSGGPAGCAFGGGASAAADAMHRAAPLAPYLNLEIWHYCYVHASVAITLTGGSDIMLFIRESRRNQRAEKAAEERYEREQERYEREQEREQERYEREQERAERMLNMVQSALEQAHEERRAAEERYQQYQERAAEERRAVEERYRQDQERAAERAAEERRLAEERYEARAEADRQALVGILTQFSDALARNGDDTRRQTGP